MNIVDALYLGLAVYFAAGVLMFFSIAANNESIMSLYAKASRLVPGFMESQADSANVFGFDETERKIKAAFMIIVGWPACAAYLGLLLYAVRKYEAFEKQLRSPQGAPMVPGGIFGGYITAASYADDLIAERCEQVREVFAPITMDEREWFADFWAKVFGPKVWAEDAWLTTHKGTSVAVESLTMSLGGAKGPTDSLQPGEAQTFVLLRAIEGVALKVPAVNISIFFQREVSIASGVPPQPIENFIAMQIMLGRSVNPMTGVLGADSNGELGIVRVEWRQNPQWNDDDTAEHWSHLFMYERLNGLPLAHDSTEEEMTAWVRASIGNEDSVANDIVYAMHRVLNNTPVDFVGGAEQDDE